MVRRTASSTADAWGCLFKEYLKSMAIERMAATGFTIPLPEISGAEPVLLITLARVLRLELRQGVSFTVDRFINPIHFCFAVWNARQTRARQ
jgi:hypothetical protein